MNAREAYAAGKHQGFSAVIYGEYGPDMDRDEIMSEAFEVESNSRQYADHPSYDIRSDAAWEAYGRGVSVGIKQGYASRFGKKRAKKVGNPAGRRRKTAAKRPAARPSRSVGTCTGSR